MELEIQGLPESLQKIGVKEKIAKICRVNRVVFLAIFGSYARGEQKKNSDVDILVEFNKPIGIEFIDLAEELERILKIKVDLVSKNGVKSRYFKEIEDELIYV